MITTGIIFVWSGTVASIPTNWIRETTLDSKFPKATAASTNPDVTGGANTHTHTAPTHTHTMSNHTHTGTADTNTGTEDDTNDDNTLGIQNHSHAFTSSTSIGGDLVDAVSYASANNQPPYHSVIFIKPNSQPVTLQSSIIGYFNTTTPSGWNFCDGTSGTPDLRNKYLFGASTGADSGTTGGSLTHSHDISHTHTDQSHTHSGSTNVSGSSTHNLTGAGANVFSNHTHTLTLDATSIITSLYTSTAGSAETVEPAYYKLSPIQNTSGGVSQPKGIIGLWLGTLASIPVGWNLCDGTRSTPDLRDKFIKCANTVGEIGSTGGSNTHSHAASNSHNHTTSTTHTHTGSTAAYSTGDGSQPIGSAAVARAHSHTVSGVSDNTGLYGSITISSDSSNNEPAYRTVAYIQFEYEIGGGALLGLL